MSRVPMEIAIGIIGTTTGGVDLWVRVLYSKMCGAFRDFIFLNEIQTREVHDLLKISDPLGRDRECNLGLECKRPRVVGDRDV